MKNPSDPRYCAAMARLIDWAKYPELVRSYFMAVYDCPPNCGCVGCRKTAEERRGVPS